jgi:hypothetical protein
MATAAQIDANQLNAQSSTGPTSEEGKQASSQNRTTHGLCHNHTCFYLLAGEDPQKYSGLYTSLKEEHQPQTETERILVRHLAQHEWLRTRALRLQQTCFDANLQVKDNRQFGLYLRYQTTHERAFYKALKELQTIRTQRIKEQIGFESQKLEQAAEQRAAEAHNLKKQAFELKKQEFELKKERLASQKQPEKRKTDPSPSASSQNGTAPAPATSPGDWEMAA